MSKILNLTQHQATPDQLLAGVVEPNLDDKKLIRDLITFHNIPTPLNIKQRARTLAVLVIDRGFDCAMIGGASYLMSQLELEMLRADITVYYAFSKRVATETQNSDGSMTTTYTFKHIGFYIVPAEE